MRLNPLCAGPVTVQMMLISNPSLIVAESQPITLVVPTGVGSTAPCDPYLNAMFFDGTGYIFTGTELVNNGAFSTSSATATPSVVTVGVIPAQSSQGSNWTLSFATPSGTGALHEQVYATAARYPFQTGSNAGLSVTGSGRGCNTDSGKFEIQHMVVANNQVTEFLATFEQHCEQQTADVLRGCIKYTR